MFERVLHDSLTEDLRTIAAKKAVLDAFVASLPFDAPVDEGWTVEQVIRDFAAQKKPVIMGYATTNTIFPVWSIVLAGEQEDLRALGDEGADDDENGNPIKESVWLSTYQILVYSRHPDITLYLYSLLRALLIERRSVYISSGDLMNITTLSGAELSPDQIYLPEFLFARVLTLTAQSRRNGLAKLGDLRGQEQPLRARRVAGVHVRDGTRPRDRVRHNVIPSVGDDGSVESED